MKMVPGPVALLWATNSGPLRFIGLGTSVSALWGLRASYSMSKAEAARRAAERARASSEPAHVRVEVARVGEATVAEETGQGGRESGERTTIARNTDEELKAAAADFEALASKDESTPFDGLPVRASIDPKQEKPRLS